MNNNFKDNPLNKIIGLSIILLMGFLLVILAGIYGNWFPIIVGILFGVAYIPVVATTAISSSDYEYNFDSSAGTGDALKEFGLFSSAFLLTLGFALPILLHHSLILTKTATVLTIIGGVLIFGTVFTFTHFFDEKEEELGGLGDDVI